MIWPCASQAWELLDGVVKGQSLGSCLAAETDITNKESTAPQPDADGRSAQNGPSLLESYWVQDAGSRATAETTGLDVPGSEPSPPCPPWSAQTHHEGVNPTYRSLWDVGCSFLLSDTSKSDAQPAVDDWMSKRAHSRSIYAFDSVMSDIRV